MLRVNNEVNKNKINVPTEIVSNENRIHIVLRVGIISERYFTKWLHE